MIRELTESDLPALESLRTDPTGSPADRQKVRTAISGLLPRLFLSGPWSNPQRPGLIYEEADGGISGMLAIGERKFRHGDATCRVAISADLFVAPEARPRMVGFHLLRAFLNGPQDLAVSDIANEHTRRMWVRMGGTIASAWNQNWIAILRPAALAASRVTVPGLAGIARAGSRLAEPLASRLLAGRLLWRPGGEDRGVQDGELNAAEYRERLGELTEDEELRPVVGHHEAEWIWRRLEFVSPGPGPVTAATFRNARGELLGWCLYKTTPQRTATVLQLAARTTAAGAVIDRLLGRLFDEGVAAVSGRIQPRFWQPLADRGCWFVPRQTFTLVHSRRRELIRVFQDGRAWLSPIDGEGPLNIWNEPELALERLDDLPDCGPLPEPAVEAAATGDPVTVFQDDCGLTGS